METLLLLAIVWITPIVIIGLMADSRGRSLAWILWPVLLGWIGWFIAFLMLVNQPKTK